MTAMNRFAYTYFNSDPDALGDKSAAQEKAERMADFMKDLRKEKELDELREASDKPTSAGLWLDDGYWIAVIERQPEPWQWPIFAYFGKACDGCRGPSVMRTNWNSTFTHWRMIPMKAQWDADKTIALPEPPNEKGQP